MLLETPSDARQTANEMPTPTIRSYTQGAGCLVYGMYLQSPRGSMGVALKQLLGTSSPFCTGVTRSNRTPRR